MNNIFCIISAIKNDYGAFSYKQRVEQLFGTIISIKKYAPNSDIALVDCSEEPLPQELTEELFKHIHFYCSCSGSDIIQFLKHNSKDDSEERAEKKAFGEIIGMINFLQLLKQINKKYKRVFKIAGRYQLNNNFNLSFHELQQKNIVILKRMRWYNELILRLRLWSFDYSLVDDMLKLFNDILNKTISDGIHFGSLPTIELSVYKHFTSAGVNINEVDVIGVEGYFGTFGSRLNE